LAVLARHDLPLVHVTLSVPLGGYDERRAELGFATLTAAMLTKGTTRHSGDALAALIESRGGELAAGAEEDTTHVTCQGLARDLSVCFELIADVITHPTFPATELGPVKDQIIAALEQRRDQPGDLADDHFESLVYGDDHPDGWVLTPADVSRIKRSDLAAFWKRATPEGATLAVTGDVEAEKVQRLAEAAFGNWRGPHPKPRPHFVMRAAQPTHVWLVDKPELSQATFVLGHASLSKRDPDLYAFELVNDALGGSDFSSRLMQEVRVRRALTYGIGSDIGAGLYDGAFRVTASSKNETVVEALRETIAQLSLMKAQGPTALELAHAQSYWAGSYPFSLENPEALLDALLRAARHGLDDAFVQELAVRLARVTPAEAAAVARRRLDPEHLVIVIVGKADVVRPALVAAALPFTERSARDPISAVARPRERSRSVGASP
jgi:zinc protease